jgi:hypothetical protein
MAETYLTVDYNMGQTSQDLTDVYNQYGQQGWELASVEVTRYDRRRAVFAQGAGPAEYLVVDYDAGKPAQTLTDDLNGYGVDGWQLKNVDLARSNVRRAIFIKTTDSGGSGGGLPEAPQNGLPYGRMDAVWTQVCATPIDGGSF